MITEHSVIINYPTAEVFAIVSNLENMPHYESFAIAAKKTSEGQIGVGTTFEVTARILLWKIRTTLDIIEWQPDHVFVIKSGQLKGISSQTKYTFETVKAATKLTITDDTQLGNLFKFLEPLLAKNMQKRFPIDMNNMKTYLESAIT